MTSFTVSPMLPGIKRCVSRIKGVGEMHRRTIADLARAMAKRESQLIFQAAREKVARLGLGAYDPEIAADELENDQILLDESGGGASWLCLTEGFAR